MEEINSQPQPHAEWSQNQLEECAMLLLTQFMELQELQASTIPPLLMNKVSQDNHSMESETCWFFPKEHLITHCCVSVRVHSISKLCEMSLNLNFKRNATPTYSGFWPQTSTSPRALLKTEVRSKQRLSPAELEQLRPRTSVVRCVEMFQSERWTKDMETTLLLWLTSRMSVQVLTT